MDVGTQILSGACRISEYMSFCLFLPTLILHICYLLMLTMYQILSFLCILHFIFTANLHGDFVLFWFVFLPYLMEEEIEARRV